MVARFNRFEVVSEIHWVYLETIHESSFGENVKTQLKIYDDLGLSFKDSSKMAAKFESKLAFLSMYYQSNHKIS